VWAASQIAVVPSTEPEPFGRVAIEAMAHSLPVVAAAHGGLTEIVVDGQTGHLVAPADPSALAAAIGKLASEPALRNRLGAAGRIRQHSHFTQQEHDRKLMQLIDTLADRRTPGIEVLA
jgi:glycosyltransferase involved in cell wall biosynthesis